MCYPAQLQLAAWIMVTRDEPTSPCVMSVCEFLLWLWEFAFMQVMYVCKNWMCASGCCAIYSYVVCLLQLLTIDINYWSLCSKRLLLKSLLNQFENRMEHKWDSIGIELKLENLVYQLRKESESHPRRVCTILCGWIDNGGKGTLVKVSTLIDVLKSPHVALDDVANDLEAVRILENYCNVGC